MSEVNTVAQLRQKHVNDFNAGNLEGMAEQISEESITMPPNQSPLVGGAAVMEFLREGMASANTTMQVQPKDLVVEGAYAIDSFNWTQEITLNSGESSSDSGNCVWVWRKEQDGEWRLWRTIWNSDREAQNVWTGAAR